MKKKYEVLCVVGEGAYGIVYKCRNKETGQFVAIKKFKEVEDKLVQKTMKRELKMLQMLKHKNIVEFQEAFIHKRNLFLVFEYVKQNLLQVLENSPDGLNPKLIRSIIFQMCKSVHYLHKNQIIHRDVKPENLLVNENMEVKLCDFGFARKIVLNEKNNNIGPMTDYVATRWYRSPELLLSNGVYGPEVDYWAIGCIMGELADRNPMFPGDNEIDQLDCIIKVLGNLPKELVKMFYNNPIYEGKELLKVTRPESLERRYMGKLGPTAIDFMKGLLALDPNKRLNDETVFKHKYFACFMDDPENKYLLESQEKNEENRNEKIHTNEIKYIKKEKSFSEVQVRNNNLTNINNEMNNKDKESSVRKKQEKIIEKIDSRKNILKKNNISTNELNLNLNNNEKKRRQNVSEENINNLSIDKKSNEKKNLVSKNPNMTLHDNFHNIKIISFSQGKSKLNNNKSNYNNLKSNNSIKNITQNTFNLKKININGSNYLKSKYNDDKKTNDLTGISFVNLDGYKTFFNINKSKDKYNYKINQGYIKEEGKKYANQNINVNNVIDENEEYPDYQKKKKIDQKKQLLVKYSDIYKYNNKNVGYGTFYNYGMRNNNLAAFGKKKNATLLPQLNKIYNNKNGSNSKDKVSHKNNYKYY